MLSSTRSLRVLFLLALVLCCPRNIAAATLYTVGPGLTLPGPSGFYSVSSAGTATWLFDFNDGTLGFNGGLAFEPGGNLFYAIANHSSGSSILVSFSLGGGGTFTTIGALGEGFVSGLAYNSSDGYLYGISTDVSGNSSLNRISLTGGVVPVGVLGTGFYGGLTFRSSDGLLYAFSGDTFGVQREFHSIDLATASTTWLFELGDGSASFNGGVAWSVADSLFYVVSSDGSGSAMQTLTPAGTLTPVGGIGDGFWNVGLVDATPIPEPSLWLPLAAAVAAGAGVRFRRRA